MESLWVNPVADVLIGESDSAAFTVSASPSFDGIWKITAQNANGLVINTQFVGAAGFHPSIGRPFVGIESTAVEACLGDVLVLEVSYQPQTTYQWFEDGVPIDGANENRLSFEVVAKHSGATFSCVATNACGSSTGGPFHITTSPGAASGVVDWLSCREHAIEYFDGGYWGCSTYAVETLRVGTCQAIWTTLASDSMTVALGAGSGTGSLGSRVEFRLERPAVLSFTSSRPLFDCFSTPYNHSDASLSGPIQASLTPGSTGGTGSVELVPGTYTVEAGVNGGTLGCGWQCNGCGPTCYSFCEQCGAWGSLSLSLTIALRPCSGDLNADRQVSGSDLVRLFNAWGASGVADEDLDLDGFVGNSDLTILLANWGACP
jgi:hypothetical protein